MYMQLGFHYVELYHTNKISENSFMRRMEGEECLIEDGAVLYQIAAMYDYNLSVYERDEDDRAVFNKQRQSIGAKVPQFYKKYCKDNGEIYNNGMYFFENITEQDAIVEDRKYIDHFKYYVHLDKSMMEMYSGIYDRFFAYDVKLKKSVSYIIPNILLSYFIKAQLSFETPGEFELTEKSKNGIKTKYVRNAANISIDETQTRSDYFTYKLVDISNANRLDQIKRDKEEFYVKARSDIFVKQVLDILNYKREN